MTHDIVTDFWCKYLPTVACLLSANALPSGAVEHGLECEVVGRGRRSRARRGGNPAPVGGPQSEHGGKES